MKGGTRKLSRIASVSTGSHASSEPLRLLAKANQRPSGEKRGDGPRLRSIEQEAVGPHRLSFRLAIRGMPKFPSVCAGGGYNCRLTPHASSVK